MFEHHLVKGGVVTGGDKFLSVRFIKAARFFQQPKESATTVIQMRGPLLRTCRSEGMDIEADVFPIFPVTVSLERADLVESDAQVRAAERFVLVELQPILVVQMQRP